MSTVGKKRTYKEMRVRKVPIEIHKAIVAHQGLLAQKTDDDVSLDEAAIDLWKKAIITIPALNS